jgi:hypothetical protein
VEDSSALMNTRAREQKVLLIPGNVFFPELDSVSSYVRASFSTASEADINTALQRLGVLLLEAKRDREEDRDEREKWKIRNESRKRLEMMNNLFAGREL